MGTIGIKLAKREFSAACAKILRKYRDISIADVKKLVADGDHLMTCDYIDAEGIGKILMLRQELLSENIPTVLYEHEQVTTVEFLNNLLGTYEEIAEEVEEDMNNEALAEEESDA